jgi:Non-repetitive/WGA-negative nucleoporin C-terminal
VANFIDDRSIRRPSAESSTPQNYELGWEQDLYHKRRDTPQHDGSSVAPPTPSNNMSSTESMAYGIEVTTRDAVDTCYALILYHLSGLLNSSRTDLADSMVSAASDTFFLEAFFLHLLENDSVDTLLRIDNPAQDKWLRDRMEPDLLWRYCNVQRRHSEAGQVALDRAKASDIKLSLSKCIEWLSRSLNSFNSAVDEGQRGRFDLGSTEHAAQKAKEVSDSLIVARLQSRILSSISSSKPNEVTPDLDRLRNFLVPVSELYNDFAAALDMYTYCLRIIHICRRNSTQNIETLWKLAFCNKLLPCATRNKSIYGFLESFVADAGLRDQIKFLTGTEQCNSLPLFEEGGWEKRLRRLVVLLGKNLYGTGADFVFPVQFILSNLGGKGDGRTASQSHRRLTGALIRFFFFSIAELKQSVPGLLSPGWSLLMIAEVGVPYLMLMDAYEKVIHRNDRILLGGVDVDKHIKTVSAILELLEDWLSLAQSSSRAVGGGHGNKAHQELSRAMASGRLMDKIESIKAKIEMMPEAATSLLGRLQAIEGKCAAHGLKRPEN